MMSLLTGLHHVWHHRKQITADFDLARKYIYHEKAAGRRMKPHMIGLSPQDLTVTACFLSLPLASLLWSVVSFTISLAALCIQANLQIHGRLLLIIFFAILAASAFAMLLFFWQIWKNERHREIEDDYHLDTTLNVDPPTWREIVENQFQKLRFRKKVSQDPEAGMSSLS